MSNEWENLNETGNVGGSLEQEMMQTNELVTETETDWQSDSSMNGTQSDWQQDAGYLSAAAPYIAPEVIKSNVITGIVGAFIGSLAGVVLWILIYQLGYVAGIAGAVTIICAMLGYEKLGKTLDTKGVWICLILSIIMIFVAQQLAVTLQIVREYKKLGVEISFFDVYRNLFSLLKYADAMGDFMIDLVIGYALFIVASISTIIKAFQGNR